VRDLALEEFVLDTYRVALKHGEVIESILIPFARDLEFVETFKISRRVSASASVVSAGLRIRANADGSIQEAALAFAGVAAIPKR
jgi:xanthine dehydrogenase small subunit